MTKKNKKIVVIGGGTGISVLLRGLKKFPVDITAIVTVADDGGSSGKLRAELDVPPPGDFRNVMIALSDVEPLMEQLMQHRFAGEGSLSGHPLGNLMLSAMTNITGNFYHAIREMSKVLNVKGIVLPAANQATTLYAEYADGTEEVGESSITKAGKSKQIKRVFIEPKDVEPLPETLKALRNADMIVMGPGSLFTSVLPDLLVPKIKEGLLRSKGKKVYVCNGMTQYGETTNFTASQHVQVLHDHLGTNFVDTIVVNEGGVPSEMVEKYAEECSLPVVFDREKLEEMELEIFAENILTVDNNVIRHDNKKLARLLYSMVE